MRRVWRRMPQNLSSCEQKGANQPAHLISLISAFVIRSIYEPRHEISNNVLCATNKASDQPAHMRSLIRAFASHLNIL